MKLTEVEIKQGYRRTNGIIQFPFFGETKCSIKWNIENDGIGPYEFWGAQCYDAGTDYINVDDVNPIHSFPEIEKFIDENFDEVSERAVKIIERFFTLKEFIFRRRKRRNKKFKK